MTLVRRGDGRVRFLLGETLQDADEEIAASGDGSVILCTDQYDIYDGIEGHDGVDGQMAVNHSDHFVVDDAHPNSSENRHSFVRQWLGKFRGVSKHHLQGYLEFPALLMNSLTEWFSSLSGADS